jgi:5-methylcytosine-specific restriction protein A
VEVPAGRKSFCSNECVEGWKIRSDSTFVRIKLFERDKGICALCGQDCRAIVEELERLDYEHRSRWARSCWGQSRYRESVKENPALMEKLSELKIPPHRYLKRHRYGIWDADHIVPVVEGGGEARSLDAFRTLCCRCHKAETAALRKRRA